VFIDRDGKDDKTRDMDRDLTMVISYANDNLTQNCFLVMNFGIWKNLTTIKQKV
jgi:hypothetical protein